MVSTCLGNHFDGRGKAFKHWSLLMRLHWFWSVLSGQGHPLWSCQGHHCCFPFSAPSLFSLEIFHHPFMPLPPHSSLLKFIAVLISCHSKRLSFVTTDECFYVGRLQTVPVNPWVTAEKPWSSGFLTMSIVQDTLSSVLQCLMVFWR